MLCVLGPLLASVTVPAGTQVKRPATEQPWARLGSQLYVFSRTPLTAYHP